MNDYALIPFINEIKVDNSLDDDAMSWFQLDDEAVQIETFTTQGTQHLLESNNVVCGNLQVKRQKSLKLVTIPISFGELRVVVIWGINLI